jgi:mono/diheme cytochrome c family protein
MRLCLPISIGCLLFAGVILPRWTPAQEKKDQSKDGVPQGPNFAGEIRPIVQKYCFECHSTQKKKAGLDLEAIAADASPANWPEVWDQVGERVRGREMPPAKSPQPTEDERQKLHDWVAHVAQVQVSCEKLTKEQLEQSTAGYTMSRRLNRTEYNNTVRDLFGVDIHPGDLLPSEGGGGEGFDNTGGTLFTTPAHMERYLEAAELVLETLFAAPDAKEDSKAAKKVDPLQVQEARRKLLSALPGPNGDPREGAVKILRPFMTRAFRRPVKDEELNRYVALFDKASKRGDSFEQSLRLVLKGVLISPHFLFLVEPPPEKVGPYRLGQYEIASHLSYFLWASMPDDDLLQLAAAGKLHDNEILRGQVRRMIRDGRARGLAECFAVQWLGVGPLGPVVRPDSKLFPEFTDELAAAMREETILFFDSIIREDRSVLDLINADYTFVNEPLAKLYQIDGVSGPEMRRVQLQDPLRGGVLGQASILTVTSHPHRTSPVLRGRWVLQELLGADVPPPPPNVPDLPEKDKEGKPLPLRQQLEKHRSKVECAGCHSKMDPLGFGLENFDPLGRWRTELNGQPIDTVGVLPTGEKFEGPVELKKLLLDKRRPEFLRNLCRKMLGYALGREINKVDMCVVQDCANALENGDFRVSRLLEAIVVSYPFSHRYHKAEDAK